MKANLHDAYRLLHQGTLALAEIERSGVRIDTEYLKETYADVGKQIEELSHKLTQDEVYESWRRRFGGKAKLGSREQLAAVIFGDLGYKIKGLTGTGRARTDEAAFDDVDLPFVQQYVQLEKLKKCRGTYLRGLLRELVDGYVHPMYNLNIAETFRSSCEKPNFQNIPSRLEFMKNIIRRCFIPRTGHQIVELDFKGIEVGISCCYHHDPTLVAYVSDKSKDMHRDTAMELFFVDQKDAKVFRHLAKNKFVFPQFYGDYYASCAKSIWEELLKMGGKAKVGDVHIFDHLKEQGITRLGDCDPDKSPENGTFEKHVKWVEDQFWNKRFPVYTSWKKRWYQQYLAKGYLQYHTGFIAKGDMRRNQVINFAVQGSAFHCLLWCLIQLQKWLVKNKMQSKIIGQIHDSMIMDVHEQELDEIITKAQEIMSVDLPNHWQWIAVPLEVEIEVAPPGKSWLEKGKWVKSENGWGLKV